MQKTKTIFSFEVIKNNVTDLTRFWLGMRSLLSFDMKLGIFKSKM